MSSAIASFNRPLKTILVNYSTEFRLLYINGVDYDLCNNKYFKIRLLNQNIVFCSALFALISLSPFAECCAARHVQLLKLIILINSQVQHLYYLTEY